MTLFSSKKPITERSEIERLQAVRNHSDMSTSTAGQPHRARLSTGHWGIGLSGEDHPQVWVERKRKKKASATGSGTVKGFISHWAEKFSGGMTRYELFQLPFDDKVAPCSYWGADDDSGSTIISFPVPGLQAMFPRSAASGLEAADEAKQIEHKRRSQI